MINNTRIRLRRELTTAHNEITALHRRLAADEAEIGRLNTLVDNLADENLELETDRKRALVDRDAEHLMNENLRIQLDALTKDPTARALAERLADATQANQAMDVPVTAESGWEAGA